MLLWPEKSSSFYWPLAAAAAPSIMLATSRQLAASFFTQLAGGDSYVATEAGQDLTPGLLSTLMQQGRFRLRKSKIDPFLQQIFLDRFALYLL